ncbi:cilia- and flagella-associated protein 221-like [Lineus longissimus]|uniref:cilia- and flagella-associated protein 221-like n=1 Tax=Lineus longissimus TaxID=88925 RepID=UPI002B4C42E9
MAAAKAMSRPTTLNGHQNNGILLDTLQLVAPRKELQVPNHLLETKIYSKVAQNSVVQARPAVIHFGGFELGKTLKQTLWLGNVSTEVQRYHIIPPQSKYFSIKYTKNDRLVPGLTLDCVIEFTPDEWRYYYDCLRIHCKGEDNLIIPIHAYPVMNTADFPDHVDFPPVPVGQKKSTSLPLRCNCPIDFEYQVTLLQPHPAFKVKPVAGVIPANGSVDINVTFSPADFSTCNLTLQVNISQFNAKPLVCRIVGYSAPGLLKDLTMKSFIQDPRVLDPTCISPIDRCRRKKKRQEEVRKSVQEEPQEIERNGIKFPADLNTPYAVACVLNQEPGKLRAKDLREAVLTKQDSTPSTRQMKEALFEHQVRQNVYEERQNQLRWQVKLGDEQISIQEKVKVLDQRVQATKDYKYRRGDPLEDEELGRTCSDCISRRTFRDHSEIGKEGIQFDLYTNDSWAVRHKSLSKFAQAGRKVIIRMRADDKIKYLKTLVQDIGKRKQSFHHSPSKLLQEKEEQKECEVDKYMTADKIKSVTFPTYVPPNVKDDMAPDALDKLPVDPTVVFVKRKVPYFNLKVPQNYKLMGYKYHNIQESSSGYVPPKLSRPLRTGAEDEIISLPAQVKPPIEGESPEPINEGDMKVEEVETPLPLLTLAPPNALFKPIEYPALHIFNPAPGLQVFQPPLPYAETDPDFHLCPLPRYVTYDKETIHTATQKRFLDREDVIRGVMTWKKFPSQGLTSLSLTPTLTNVWVPRWTDPFSGELTPEEVPALFDGLPDDDRENILQLGAEEPNTDEVPVSLTPAMVNAQFALIDTSTPTDEKPKDDMFPQGNKMPATNIPVASTGPVPREKREQELDYFLNKKYNRLGQKVQQKVENMDMLKTNKDLVLK